MTSAYKSCKKRLRAMASVVNHAGHHLRSTQRARARLPDIELARFLSTDMYTLGTTWTQFSKPRRATTKSIAVSVLRILSQSPDRFQSSLTTSSSCYLAKMAISVTSQWRTRSSIAETMLLQSVSTPNVLINMASISVVKMTLSSLDLAKWSVGLFEAAG